MDLFCSVLTETCVLSYYIIFLVDIAYQGVKIQSLLGIAHKVECLKYKEIFDLGGRGVKTPRQCLVDIDFNLKDFQSNVGLIDSTFIV